MSYVAVPALLLLLGLLAFLAWSGRPRKPADAAQMETQWNRVGGLHPRCPQWSGESRCQLPDGHSCGHLFR